MITITIDDAGWVKEAIGIYYTSHSFGPLSSGPKWIVLHGTASGPGSTAIGIATNWKNTPANTVGAVSAHFIIEKDGSFVQGISILDSAWANCCLTDNPSHNLLHSSFLPAGNQNNWTISIEHVKYDSQQNSDILTPAQQETSFALVKAICEFHGIPKEVVGIGDPTHGGIIGHRNIDALNRYYCPGTYPYADLQNFLRGGPSMFSNELCVFVWNSTLVFPVPRRDTGLFNMWRSEWIAGRYRGVVSSAEYPIVLPDGTPGVAQNFGSDTAYWAKDGQETGWIKG